MISDYVESLAGALSFDRSLSRRVRQEVEDHLAEAVAADPAGGRHEAERRAIANFGDPHVIAAQFAVVSLARQTKRTGVAIILVIAGVFIAMKARVAWYAVMQCAISEDIRAVSGIVGLIDRYSFWLSVIIGIGSWAYVNGRRIPAAFYTAYCLRRFFLLCTRSDRRTRGIGDQRWRAHSASAARSGTARRISNPDRLDGDRNRRRRPPRFANSQHRAASDIYSGLVKNLRLL